MTQLGEDHITAHQIPRLHVLYQDLGFGTRASQREFGRSVARWRQHYKTPSGKDGTALINWRIHNHDLGVMAQRFVETGSNADNFWPSEGGKSFQIRPTFPKDETTILELLRRLMWRQNVYQAKNTRRQRNMSSTQNDRSSSEETLASEDYSSPNALHASQPSLPSQRQVLSRPAEDTSVARDQFSYNAATGLLSKSVRGTGALPVDDENWHGSSGPKPFPVPKSLTESTDNPSNFCPGSANSTPTTCSSDLSPTNGSNGEENKRGQSSQQKRSHPLLLDSTNVESESNKRKRTSLPAELDGTSLQTPTNTPRNFRPGDTNSALKTATSRNSGDSEEDIQGQTTQQKRSYTSLSGSDDIGNESNQQDHISTPSQLHSTSSPTLASDLEPSDDLDNRQNRPRKNVQLGNSDSPQSQIGPSPNESGPSKTAKGGLPTSTVRPKVDIFIVESSGPRISIKEWPGGSLRGRTLKSIFNEVTTAFPGQPIQRIRFQLETLKMENAMECLIERDDDKIFGVMMQKFNKRMKERKRAGETKFKLYLEPERGVQEAAVSEALESEEDYL